MLSVLEGGCCAELADEAEESGGGSLALPLLVEACCESTEGLTGEFRRVAAGSALIDFDAAAKGR